MRIYLLQVTMEKKIRYTINTHKIDVIFIGTAAWMKNKKQDPYSFNTNIPSHNQFPTNEEREKIEKKVFTERRSQANRKLTKNCDNAGSSPSCKLQ